MRRAKSVRISLGWVWVLGSGSGGLFFEVDGIAGPCSFAARAHTKRADGPWFSETGEGKACASGLRRPRRCPRWFSFAAGAFPGCFWAHPAPSSYYSPSPFSCFSRSPDNLLSRTTYIPPCQKFWILRFLSSASDLLGVAASFGVSACLSAPRLPAAGLTHCAFAACACLLRSPHHILSLPCL